MRTVTSLRPAIFLAQILPRATCSHHSLARSTPNAQSIAMARKKRRHSTRAPRRGRLIFTAMSARRLFHALLRLRIVAGEHGEIIEHEKQKRREQRRGNARAADAPGDIFVEDELY